MRRREGDVKSERAPPRGPAEGPRNGAVGRQSAQQQHSSRSSASGGGADEYAQSAPAASARQIVMTEAEKQKLVFHCQQAQGSPTGLISGFGNVKELYEKIAQCYDFTADEVSRSHFHPWQQGRSEGGGEPPTDHQKFSQWVKSVSYTHLTLPTIYSV